MNPPNSVEQRLDRIEDELRQLKERLDGKNKGRWISRMRGQFQGDPVFDQIVRLGKEIRDADSARGHEEEPDG